MNIPAIESKEIKTIKKTNKIISTKHPTFAHES